VIEQAVYDRLKVLCAGRVYPDVAKPETQRPYITYQQVGGEVVQFIGPDLPSKLNARIMIKVWADDRLTASDLARDVEDLMLTSSLQATAIGSFVSDYEIETGLYGTRQDFSCWINR
jgi:hypothetical protein